MEYVKLENERDRKWRMVFEENDGGVEEAKKFLQRDNPRCKLPLPRVQSYPSSSIAVSFKGP